MERLAEDLGYALRKLRRAPVFAVAAILSVAVGIGANSAIFSVANALLLRASPITDPDRVVDLHSTFSTDDGFHTFSHPNYLDYRERSTTLADLAAFDHAMLSLNAGEAPELVFGALVSHNYFGVLGIEPVRGRFFTPEEGAAAGAAAHPVAVIGEGIWRTRFGGDSGILGREVLLNGVPLVIIGVAPQYFTSPRAFVAPDVWVPVAMWGELRGSHGIIESRASWGLQLVGRLAPEATVEQAQSELSLIAQALAEEYPIANEGVGVHVAKTAALPPSARVAVAAFMGVLLVVTAVVLLVACVNVGNMLLARALGRRREIAVRLAVGAGRSDIIRQLVTEALVLFVIGGAVGVAIGLAVTRILPTLIPPLGVPIVLDFGLDARVLGFAALLTLITGLAFGLVPALGSSRPDLVPALKDEEGSGRHKKSRLRGALVVGQVAMSLLLLVGAGLFLRALQKAGSIDPGFEPEGIAVAGLDLGIHGYDQAEASEFFDLLQERLRGLPIVESATLASPPPLSLSNRTAGVNVSGHEPPPGRRSFTIGNSTVTAGYFRTLGIPLLQGDDFPESLSAEGPAVAIINETMARRFWPDESPIGRRFYFGAIAEGNALEVIGVAADSKYRTLGEAPSSFIYLPYAQNLRRAMMTLVRARGDVSPLLRAIRSEVRALDPNLSLALVVPYRQLVGISLLPQRLAAWVTGVTGVIGLLLAAIGLYGVTAFSVSQRTREIGIRMALGATRRDIVRTLLVRGALLTSWGLVIGLGLALALTRFLSAYLFGVSANDPLALTSVAAVLAVVALLASYIPARRAARVEAMESLRHE